MQKVINSHCHIYPDKIAAKAVKGIRDFYDLHMSLNGTVDDLIEDGNKVGVVHYLIHSVATTPKQVKSINEFISFEVKSHPGLFTGFGTLHPDSEDIEGDLDYIIELGPEGGDKGGTIIATGTPEEVAKCRTSYTGMYLKKILNK